MIDTGGPFHPQSGNEFVEYTNEVANIEGTKGRVIEVKYPGISRRDWLAGLAMQSIYGGVGAEQVAERDERYDETNWAEVVAKNSYEMADAMIKISSESVG